MFRYNDPNIITPPGTFRNVLKRPGPWSLPSWAPGDVVGQRNGWPSNPVGANAFATRNSFGSK